MVIILVLLVLTVGGIAWELHDSWNPIGFMVAVLAGIFLAAALILLPITHYDVHATVTEIRAIEATAAEARASGDDIEGAAFRLKIAEANAQIASWQYYDGTVFGLWVPDEVRDLQPIR